MKRLTRRDFRAWLARHKPQTRVGEARKGLDCPLKHYSGRFVTSTQISRLGSFNRWDSLPSWAVAFIREIDRKRGPVTARRALRVLDGVP